jgi:methylmalonyl-CoA mutase C-terminal domain/subunit
MLGADPHTKGIRTLARLLRDRGVEVVYVGEHNTGSGMIRAAVDEDVDVIGVSFSTATYLSYTEELANARRDAGAEHIPIMVGGLIHPDDEPRLKEIGVAAAFGASTTIDDVMVFLGQLPDRGTA